jgi:predicted double-glycine peptidase
MHRSLRLLVASCAFAALEGHAQPIQVDGIGMRVPVTSLRAARIARTVLQQYDFSCGSAALATLLSHHYGLAVGEEEILRAMYAQGDQQKIRKEGFSMLDMKRYLESRGFAADGFQQTLDKLAQAGLPAIVLMNENGYHHFVVVKGLVRDRVLIGDPARGVRAMPRGDFEAAWIGGLLFVIHDHVEQARFNLAADWRAAPPAPLFTGVARLAPPGLDLPRHGPGDF